MSTLRTILKQFGNYYLRDGNLNYKHTSLRNLLTLTLKLKMETLILFYKPCTLKTIKLVEIK